MAKTGRRNKLEADPTLKGRIVGYIEQGLTDQMACSQAGISKDTFYTYIRTIPDFSDAITHARHKAHTLAVIAFRRGMTAQTTNDVITETFSETRIAKDKDGKPVPYTYTKTTTEKRQVEHAPDWRAGEAWLKRRDPENWSDKLSVEIDLEQLKTLLALLEQRNIPASELFDNLIKGLANAQRTDVSTDGT